jgi:AAA+ superfamily predicted ATPase
MSSSGNTSGGVTSKRDELRLLINSRNPIIAVETAEEDRLARLITALAVELAIPFYTWSVTTGLARIEGAPMYDTADPAHVLASISEVRGDAIFLLKDFSRYCDNDKICRHIRDLADLFRDVRRCMILSAPSLNLPPEIESECVRFELGLPDVAELTTCVKTVLAELHRDQNVAVTFETASVRRLAESLVGLPEESATRTLRRCILARGNADAGLADAVLDAKRKVLSTEALLEPVRRDASFADVAGLAHLKDWLTKRKSAFTVEGKRFGLVPPKGVLITGVQGCGKSLATRAVAAEWDIELARLDAGSLYDKYVGESEKRLRKALELAQQLSPIVLWIDEIEKAFASASSSGDADAGLSQRLLATMLTWMQDREGGVFLAATSNNISALPPEMLRKGRFDEIFFVDLPGADVRSALFAIHLKKRGRDPNTFDLKKLAVASDGFSGAEIEQAIVAALFTAFNDKQQLSTDVILTELLTTQPLSVTRAEDVQSIRTWARSRAVPAD